MKSLISKYKKEYSIYLDSKVVLSSIRHGKISLEKGKFFYSKTYLSMEEKTNKNKILKITLNQFVSTTKKNIFLVYKLKEEIKEKRELIFSLVGLTPFCLINSFLRYPTNTQLYFRPKGYRFFFKVLLFKRTNTGKGLTRRVKVNLKRQILNFLEAYSSDKPMDLKDYIELFLSRTFFEKILEQITKRASSITTICPRLSNLSKYLKAVILLKASKNE